MSSVEWASPGGGTDSVPTSNTSSPQDLDNSPTSRSPLVQRLLSILCILLCVSMTSLGVLALMDYFESPGDTITAYMDVFIAIYMLLFAALLFLYELMWWMTIDSLNRLLRKNFGFFYGIFGKATYIIFVSFLCLGLDNDLLQSEDWLKWLTGIAWMATGVLLIFLRFFKKHLVESYKPPTGGFDDGELEENNNSPV